MNFSQYPRKSLIEIDVELGSMEQKSQLILSIEKVWIFLCKEFRFKFLACRIRVKCPPFLSVNTSKYGEHNSLILGQNALANAAQERQFWYRQNTIRKTIHYATRLSAYCIVLILLSHGIKYIYVYISDMYNNVYPVSEECLYFSFDSFGESLFVAYHKLFLGDRQFAVNKIIENERIILEAARKYGLDPDLIKSIIMEEMYHADLIEQHPQLEMYIPEQLSQTRGIMQTTINSNKPYHKKLTQKDTANSYKSIDAGAFLLRNEIDRLKNEGQELNVAVIASRYNNHYSLAITKYGMRVENHYIHKPWKMTDGQCDL